MRNLSLADTTEVLRSLRELVETRIVLIGGQALNFWAERYIERGAAALEDGEPYTSKDIDFYGGPQDVERCAALLGGEAKIATLDDATESTGIVLVPGHPPEEGFEIDFLGTSYGLEAHQVRDWSIVVAVEDVQFRVLHPVIMMKSRLKAVANLIGADTPHKLRQLRAAVVCAREFLRELLDEGFLKEVKKLNKRIFKFSKTRPARVVYRDHGIDSFEAALCDDRLPDQVRTIHFPRMREALDRRRGSRFG